jgi:hypothetical protein
VGGNAVESWSIKVPVIGNIFLLLTSQYFGRGDEKDKLLLAAGGHVLPQ